MEAVTREVSRDQYQMAEASHTETPTFFTLWYPTARSPWILVSHPSLRQRLMFICTSVKTQNRIFFPISSARLELEESTYSKH